MLIAGANLHAKDIIAFWDRRPKEEIILFDDTTKPKPKSFLGEYEVITSLKQAERYFKESTGNFVIGVGGTKKRKIINDKLSSIGGKAFTIISESSKIGNEDVNLGKGLNIMPFVLISNSVSVGDGTLLNSNSSLHHDVKIGQYCDIAPGATILGGGQVGNYSMIGSNATILPNVKIGKNCLVGAGAVVTKDVPDNSLVVGVPAKVVKKLIH